MVMDLFQIYSVMFTTDFVSEKDDYMAMRKHNNAP